MGAINGILMGVYAVVYLLSAAWIYKKNVIFSSFFSLKRHWKVYHIQNSKLCFLDMKIMSLRNGGDLVNNSSSNSFFTESPPFLCIVT